MDMSCLRELVFPTVMIPGDIKIMPLDYCWLSQTNSLPPDMVRGCVEETILLYSFQLSTRQCPAFTFENIGILSCQDNVLCMQFHCSCIAELASQDIWVALLLTVSARCVRGFFHPTHKGCRETQGQNRGTRASRKVFPPYAAKPEARQEAARARAKATFQEVWQLCVEWEHGNSHWREQKVEWAAWEAWAAAENQQMPQVFGAGGVWAPHRPSKPPRKGVTARWKKSGTPLPTEKMAERFQPGTRHLSPRAIQVLRGLEPHQMRRNIFMFLAENNQRRQEQQRQFCSSRCWSSA
ncbi:uncharacterized protein [Aphelocoma coerulescens]|uniref:uncharacterized protein isoform X5 n=1 Tax=Aphelocoma coerulescens TaxID=39617 RepID=UPI0036048D29